MIQSPDPNQPETDVSTLIVKGLMLIGATFILACIILQLRQIAP